jgi:hypothetical protein
MISSMVYLVRVRKLESQEAMTLEVLSLLITMSMSPKYPPSIMSLNDTFFLSMKKLTLPVMMKNKVLAWFPFLKMNSCFLT